MDTLQVGAAGLALYFMFRKKKVTPEARAQSANLAQKIKTPMDESGASVSHSDRTAEEIILENPMIPPSEFMPGGAAFNKLSAKEQQTVMEYVENPIEPVKMTSSGSRGASGDTASQAMLTATTETNAYSSRMDPQQLQALSPNQEAGESRALAPSLMPVAVPYVPYTEPVAPPMSESYVAPAPYITPAPPVPEMAVDYIPSTPNYNFQRRIYSSYFKR